MLKIVNNELRKLNINYEFMRWTGDNVTTYFTGEYQELETLNEDGYRDWTFMLNGFTTGDYIELESAKEIIRAHFPSVYGLRVKDGDDVYVIFYKNAFVVPTTEAELKRIQVNLDVKKWGL